MEAVITEIRTRGDILLSLKNRVIPPEASVWKKGTAPANDVTDAAGFPAAFPLDDLDSARLEVTVFFPGGDSGGNYTLTLMYNNNIVLFEGSAQPADNSCTNEKDTRCFSLVPKYRPCCFLRAYGKELNWRLINVNTNETLDMPTLLVELYWLYEDSCDLYRRGIPVEILREFDCHLDGEAPVEDYQNGRPHEHSPEKIMASIVTWVFNRVPPRYDIDDGLPNFSQQQICSGFKFTLSMDKYLAALNDPVHGCNCYDVANIVLAFLHLVGIRDVQYAYMQPFGYLKKTPLIGRGPCNNPFYGDKNSPPVVPENDPGRTGFSNHAFCITADGKILDACAGPHTGTETVEQYIENAVDPMYPVPAKYETGTAGNIYKGVGVTLVDQTRAPGGLPDFPLTKAFMEELGISVDAFKAQCDKYVVFSPLDPLACPFLSDQPRSLFYSDITHGLDEVVKTWKYKQKDKDEDIKINIHIFSGDKLSALYRFIELGSAFSADVLRYGKGDPALGQYSARSSAVRVNMRYFWVYYNMIVDIVYHDSTADVNAVNRWFRQQAETSLKDSIGAELPSVDDIRCDNLSPKVGDTVTVSMKPFPNIRYDFNFDGTGLRFRDEAPDKFVFRAYREGDTTLTILAVDQNTLLMKARAFELKIG